MGKIKNLIAAVGLATVLGSGCMETQTPEGRPVRFVTHPVAVSGPSENVGKDLRELLKDEFDYVGWYDLCKKRDNYDRCLETNLVIRGEKKEEGKYVTVFGMNLDCACQAYTRGRPLLDIILGRDIVTEMCEGTVVTHNMNRNTAKKFVEFLSYRIPKNEENCKEWTRFIKQYYGPSGPTARHSFRE